MLLFIFFLHTNYPKIVEKDFIYYFIIAILSGANRLTFRGEQVIVAKRPGTLWLCLWLGLKYIYNYIVIAGLFHRSACERLRF